MITFPRNFLWGAASSAHQTEGNNIYSDWWQWEQQGLAPVPSKDACQHYQRFREDFACARQLHHTAHRFSIEWARVQPEADSFDEGAIQHYREVVRHLRASGMEPVVTRDHFTLPQWFAARGGWLQPDALVLFMRYVRRVAEHLSEDVRYWVTINEPMVFAYQGYVTGAWPPGERSVRKAMRVARILSQAHAQAYRQLHDVYRGKGLVPPMVSFAQALRGFEPQTSTLRNRMAARLRGYVFNAWLLDAACRMHVLDYVGVNYYTRDLVQARDWSVSSLTKDVGSAAAGTEQNMLGWDICPQWFTRLLVGLKQYGLPVFILENGICTLDDAQRWRYIHAHLNALHAAIQEQVDVIGYLYWALTDNFEWDKGFVPRFGLIEVDYATQQRFVRPSAQRYAQVCASGTLE
jgi:beta-glucosidase